MTGDSLDGFGLALQTVAMPYCAGCGTQMAEGTLNCPNCGRPTQAVAAPGVAAPAVAPRTTDGQAVASLVLGIAGIVICPFLVLSIIAIILGSQAKARIAANPALEGDGMAKAGVILGWVGLGISALWIVFYVVMFVVSAGGGFL